MSTATAVRPGIETDWWSGSDSEDERPALMRVDEIPHQHPDDNLLEDFARLAEELEDAGAGLSSTRRIMVHPAFAEILALGRPAIPLAINRLRGSDNRPLWLRVLSGLGPFPPGAGESTIEAAAGFWIQWATAEGLAT